MNNIKEMIKTQLYKKGFVHGGYDKVSDAVYRRNYEQNSLDNKRFYNIGAGSFYHRYWTNIDYATDYYAEHQKIGFINHNLMSLADIPIESNTAEIVYTSHTIEHISEPAVHKMLSEAFRMLKQGGGVRITAPNAWLDYCAYQNNDKDYFFWYKNWIRNFSHSPADASIEQLFLTHMLSPRAQIILQNHPNKLSDVALKEIVKTHNFTEAMNILAEGCKFDEKFAGNHISWWTPEKVMELLHEIGFSQIYLSAYAQSGFAVMRDVSLFDSTMPYVSFYVEAIK